MTIDEKSVRRISKFLSLVLRHQPDKIGIQLDAAGWVEVEVLLEALRKSGQKISRDLLEHVVGTNDKQRFTIDEAGQRIRATQGHSVEVELGYEPADPPAILIHGTPETALSAIRESGLQKMKRHHVHLHCDSSTASAVGARRGTPVLLKVKAQEMANEGFVFYVTANQVWLTDHVPPRFIEFPDDSSVSG
ncbi:MAG: RNA 2'-phosphotransferase [Planctomycetaceae bacterium]